MIFGLEFSDNVDPAAAVTFVLAVIAIIGLVFTGRSLKQSQQQIRLGQAQLGQTQEEIELSRKEVEEAHRPVVVPFVDSGRQLTIASGHSLAARPFVPQPGLLVIPVKNIGPGPALRMDATIEGLNPAGEWSAAWSGPQIVGAVATAVGVGEMMPLEIDLPAVGDVPGFRLSLAYDDVAGKRWLTSADWIQIRARYEQLDIRPDETPS